LSVRSFGLLPVALCALGGHFVLYRTLSPADGNHAYFGWYEPLVAGLSLASFLLLVVLVLASLAGGEGARARVSPFLVPAVENEVGLALPARTVRLALASGAFLVVQESVERSVAAGHPSPAVFSSGQMLLVLLSLGLLAGIVARVESWCRQLVSLAVRRARQPIVIEPAPLLARWHVWPSRVRRRNPLADRRGLRAPPLAV